MKRALYILSYLSLSLFFENHIIAQTTKAIPYYDNINFNHRFFAKVESDEKSNFYVIDLTQLTTTFEKKYFETLTFQESKFIRIDSGNPEFVWFRIKKIFQDEEIQQLFLIAKKKSIDAALTMSESQKQKWLSDIGK